jgi:hypothetical protein
MNVEQMYARLHEALEDARNVCAEIKRATGVDPAENLDLDPNPDAVTQPTVSSYSMINGVSVAVDVDSGFFRFESIDKRANVLRKHGASQLPNRFMIDPHRLNGVLTGAAAEQVILNTNFARFFMGMLGGLKPGGYANAAIYTEHPFRKGQWVRGDYLPNTAAFAGDHVIRDKLVWEGPSLQAAEIAANRLYDEYDV